MNIPFVDKAGRVVGWTSVSPEFVGGKIHHPEAASHFAGALAPNYVELTDPSHLAEAGAPAGWTDSWRCIGLCETASSREDSALPGTAPPVFNLSQRAESSTPIQVGANEPSAPVSLLVNAR